MFLAPPPNIDEAEEGGYYQNQERRRKRGQEKYLRGLASYPALQDEAARDYSDVYIQGYAAEVFTDDGMALQLHEERHMIPWRGEEQDPIFIDRFDGRALLDDRAKFIKLKGRRKEEGEGAEEAGLDRDRYSDLPGYIPPPTAQDMAAGTASVGEGESNARAGPVEAGKQQEEEEDGFVPSFPVPAGMVVPTSWKVHRLLGMTARRARKEGQFEFLLRVKQADNPTFSFLHPDDPLHPFYNYLKEEEREGDVDYAVDPKALQEAKEEEERRLQEVEARKKLAVRSLLGSAYDDSDEDDSDDEVLIPPKERRAVIDKLAEFVKRNGQQFEDKVREREVANPRFSFLDPKDIYYKYYRSLVPTADPPEGKKKKKKAQEGEADGQEGAKVEGAEGEATPAEEVPPKEEDVLSETRAPIVISLPKAAKREATATEEGEEGEKEEAKEEEGKEGEPAVAVEAPSESEEGEGGSGEEEGEEEEEDEVKQKRLARLKRARLMRGHFQVVMTTGQAMGTQEKEEGEVEEGEIPYEAIGSEPSTSQGVDKGEGKEREASSSRKHSKQSSRDEKKKKKKSRKGSDEDKDDRRGRKKKERKREDGSDDDRHTSRRDRSRSRSRSRSRDRRKKSRSRSRDRSRNRSKDRDSKRGGRSRDRSDSRRRERDRSHSPKRRS